MRRRPAPSYPREHRLATRLCSSRSMTARPVTTPAVRLRSGWRIARLPKVAYSRQAERAFFFDLLH
jgi:hypothetical protein